MTKAEFVDLLARDGRIGSKKAAARPSRRCSTAISRRSPAGDSVNFTGFGKFSVAERGPRQGVNPRTGERITIAGGRVPRFSAGAAPEVPGQGLTGHARRLSHPAPSQRRVSPAPFADRLAALVEERQSQLCLGLDPDPSRLDPGRGGRRGAPPSAPREAVAADCRSLIERAGPACVAAKLQLACFERLGAPGLGGARAHRGGGARGRACW